MNTPTNTSPIASIKTAKLALAGYPPAEDGLCYIVIGPYCWGKANTAKAAAKLARDNGGRGVYKLHLCNVGAEIDQVSGGLYYQSAVSKVNLLTFRQQ